VTRTPLPSRRPNVTRTVTWTNTTEKETRLLITVGFDEHGDAREVFCADFKAGSDTHAVVMDACILFSRLLQHGDTPRSLADAMCSPPSLLGTIALAVANTVRDA